MGQILLIPLLALLFAGCAAVAKEPAGSVPRVVAKPEARRPLRYLALGDSYTIGQGVAETDRFPQQTVSLLRQQGFNVAVPEYIAVTGWTTQALLDAIARREAAPTYDLVTLLIGVNDQYRGLALADYAQQFRLCLEKALHLAGGRRERVFVLSIPDYGATPFGRSRDPLAIKRAIDAFNAVNHKITRDFRIAYTNITPGSREAAKNPFLVAADRLHPSRREYAKWAAALAPKMAAAFR